MTTAGALEPAGALNRLRDAIGSRASRRFECCDTSFRIVVEGVRPERGLRRGVDRARGLEARLDAFDDGSAVAALHRDGRVEDPHVARLVERGLDYRDRTTGLFDVLQGERERRRKRYIRGDVDAPTDGEGPDRGGPASTDVDEAVRVDGDVVASDVRLDLNGLAKGYIVDRAAAAAAGPLRRSFVDGGGDMTPPPGAVDVASPYGDDRPLTRLDTEWRVASSGGYRRRRGDVDHLYDPRRDADTGASDGEAAPRDTRIDAVTVVARRDTVEADALATAAAVARVDDALGLIEGWRGAEALVVADGVYHRTGGFAAHEA